MAKKKGVDGWHSMRKDELIKALVKQARKAKSKSSANGSNGKHRSSRAAQSSRSRENGAVKNGRAHTSKTSNTKPKSKNTKVARRIHMEHERREKLKDLASLNGNGKAGRNSGPKKDRAVLMVRDPYWLHAYWEISRQSIQRVQAALAEHWHTAQPTLRVLEVNRGSTTSTAERVVRDIEIHGGVRNWYIDVPDPPKAFRIAIGYRAANGKFHTLVRSNMVHTPRPGSSDAIDENWSDVAENYEKIYALSGGYSDDYANGDLQELFEERLRRPMGSPLVTRYGVGAEATLNRDRDFVFEVDAEMIVYGATKPDAHVTLAGEPVKLRPDGTFTVRMSMPDKRQVVPVVAASGDGVEQRTTVLAIERNTKVMEPMIRDANE